MPEGRMTKARRELPVRCPPGLPGRAGSLDGSVVQESREIDRAGSVMLNEAPYWKKGFFGRHDVYPKSREAGATYVGRTE
jgi:hypothetical protein